MIKKTDKRWLELEFIVYWNDSLFPERIIKDE